MIIDTEPIIKAIAFAEKLRDQYKKEKRREDYKFWKQEAYRLKSDLLRAERINA
jgi:hypothetical protein